ncbi:MAG: alpha/beta hydrolase [Rhizobiales bacterium]|nr:alpha/beta hydrolase [Hyphomicrobiales bacterium]MBI3674532.1 alpha/beta hydrolase [Hyphomicrobiales bacterium]
MSVTPIDAGMLEFYEELSARTPPEATHWPLARQRATWDEVCRAFRAPRPERLLVEDLDANDVHVRVFRPVGNTPKPGVIYFHGGGWVLGSCETHDDMCAEFAALADVVTVLVDYRLAPEHRHPAQLEDSLAVLDWMGSSGRALGIDPTHIVGAGDSAGGQMTVGLAMTLRDRGLPQLRGQVLIYPVLGSDTETPSYLRNAHAPCLTRDEMIYYLESFLGPRGSASWTDPYAVPNLAGNLSALPPAFIAVAEHDPLCDDGAIFHDKLKAAGIASKLRREPALAHSYMRARHVSAPAMAGFEAIARAIHLLAHEGMLPD